MGQQCGIRYRGNNPDRGAPVGIEELPSWAEEGGNGGIEHGMKLRSANQDRGE